MNELVTGQVDALCDQSATAVPQIIGGGGTISAKGCSASARQPLLSSQC